LCELDYHRWKRYGYTGIQPVDITPEQRVWIKVDQRGPDECWPWLGGLTPDGYGAMSRPKQIILAHRKVWELTNGPIPEGLTVDHTCHNRDKACRGGKTCLHRRCCNPAHLDAVSLAVNVARAIARRERCQHGHPLDGIFPADKWRKTPTRYCKTCYYARQRASRERRG
jgi:hypothetical protein